MSGGVWNVTLDDGGVVLGNIELKDGAVVLSVNSAARAERGRASLSGALAGLVAALNRAGGGKGGAANGFKATVDTSLESK